MPSLRVNEVVRRVKDADPLTLDRETILAMVVHLMDRWDLLYPREELGRAVSQYLDKHSEGVGELPAGEVQG